MIGFKPFYEELATELMDILLNKLAHILVNKQYLNTD